MPLGPGKPHFKVPLASNIIPYDNQDFKQFPHRHGYRWGTMHNCSSEEIQTLLQSWLYFGLLSEFLGVPNIIATLTQPTFPPENAQSVLFVASQTLDELLLSWQKNMNAVSKRSKPLAKSRLMSLDSDVVHAYKACEMLEVALPICAESPIPEILLSIKLLIIKLRGLITQYRGIPDGRTTVFTKGVYSITPPAAKLIADVMQDAGWCPFQIQELMCILDYASFYFISLIPRVSIGGISHTACTTVKCIANDVDPNNYTSRHVRDNCRCDFIAPPTGQVTSIIADGGIPLVRIQSTGLGGLQLVVEKAKSTSRYIAISHVWSDGLGNPKSNALPQCQLDALAKHFDNQANLDRAASARNRHNSHFSPEGSHTAFWMDTLCIPVGQDALSSGLRTKAINQMAAIYAGAAEVFVLDSMLQRIRLDSSSSAEILSQSFLALGWEDAGHFKRGL